MIISSTNSRNTQAYSDIFNWNDTTARIVAKQLLKSQHKSPTLSKHFLQGRRKRTRNHEETRKAQTIEEDHSCWYDKCISKRCTTRKDLARKKGIYQSLHFSSPPRHKLSLFILVNGTMPYVTVTVPIASQATNTPRELKAGEKVPYELTWSLLLLRQAERRKTMRNPAIRGTKKILYTTLRTFCIVQGEILLFFSKYLGGLVS